MKKDFSPEARAAAIVARKNESWKATSEKQLKKLDAANSEVSESNETHYEMLQRNAKNNLPSSLK